MGKKLKWKLEDVKQEYIKRGYKPLFNEYKSNRDKLKAETIEGYLFKIAFADIVANKKPLLFSESNPYTLYNIKLWMALNNISMTLKDDAIYTKAIEPLKVVCNVCSGFPRISWNNIQSGKTCGICDGKQVEIGINDLATTRPDLIKYLKYKEDANKYTRNSGKLVSLICPDCKQEKSMTLDDLSRKGFSCPRCSDGISVPEKFVGNLLSYLNIEYIPQYVANWAKNKKYDFYIPSLDMIIEVHGRQHYDKPHKDKTCKEEQENDILKERLAKENNTKYYIVIDCRFSEFEHLKNNCVMSLSPYFNLHDIDWILIFEKCQRSLLRQICEAWCKKEETETTVDMCKLFKVARGTVITYLKRGTKLNWCKYNSKEEMAKQGSVASNSCKKAVCKYSLNNIFIEKYNSIREASVKNRIHHTTIGMCCKGKQKTSGGFIWKYENTDEHKQINIDINSDVC